LTEAGEGADALGLSRLSERSVVALVGLAFEARIAAGPRVLVICRGGSRETADLMQLALELAAVASSVSASLADSRPILFPAIA
jgi:hypothetical protein